MLENTKIACDFIKTREKIVTETSFGEHRDVTKAMKVIKEALSVERKRMETTKKKPYEKTAKKQRAKTLIVSIKRGLRREDIENDLRYSEKEANKKLKRLRRAMV